jgi:hypothetical protein
MVQARRMHAAPDSTGCMMPGCSWTNRQPIGHCFVQVTCTACSMVIHDRTSLVSSSNPTRPTHGATEMGAIPALLQLVNNKPYYGHAQCKYCQHWPQTAPKVCICITNHFFSLTDTAASASAILLQCTQSVWGKLVCHAHGAWNVRV